ncbi:MAG: PilZ domain-containing protein [Myxococcales bacterium]|nr:PilZ domain-containing protein [Myxococcales bacterium]
MFAEHRHFRRAPLTGPVRFWDWSQPRTALAREVSAGGVFVQTPSPMPEGAHVTVRLELPGAQGMTVLGRVVRTVQGGVLAAAGMGIRFLDLSPSQQRRISDFVAARALP